MFDSLFDNEDCEQLFDGLKHFEKVGEMANSLGVTVLVDAEYASFNPAVKAITHIMMMKFNSSRPVLQHTFQGYLTVSLYNFNMEIFY